MSECVIFEFERLGIDVATYDSVSKTNQEDLSAEILYHSHEEVDTLVHCWEIARRNPFNQCIVYCPDTDVFLLLIFHYPSLLNALIFRTGKGSDLRHIFIGNCYKALGSCRTNELLGFHTFTGCDQTGGFMGKSKTSRWKNFENADDNTLKALGGLGKNCLLKSYICYLFLNFNNIYIYCEVLKSVTVNCWKKYNPSRQLHIQS